MAMPPAEVVSSSDVASRAMAGRGLLLALASILAYAQAFYNSKGSVINLDPASFKQQVPGDGVWLIEFYAPW